MRRAIYFAAAVLLVVGIFLWQKPAKVHAQIDTFSTPGTFTWNVPSGVSSADFAVWGGGGTGNGSATNGLGGGGGQGGGYAIKTLTGLVTNDAYSVTVAASVAGAVSSTCGNDSFVKNPSNTTFVLAAGGKGGLDTSGGFPACNATQSTQIGDTTFTGGSGAPNQASATAGGGGGGAGSTGNGGNASGTTAGTGTSSNGGTGGAGGSGNYTGVAGSIYGGGGSGASKSNGGSRNGGGGAQGLVTVTYTISNSAPNAPTLQSPTSGSTVTSTTPNLQLVTTDPDGDTVKYKLIIYNTSANSGGNCTGTTFLTADMTASTVGWNLPNYSSGVQATYTVQSALSRGNSYCWQAQAIDQTGSNTFGSLSTASTFIVNSTPAAPTLVSPASGATGVGTGPVFTLRTTDADADYVQYRISLYQSDCSTVISGSPFDESSSQTGWSGQDSGPGGTTAYNTDASIVTNSTLATYTIQTTLSTNTTYCWKADAIDPAGTNTFGSVSATQLFTTASGSGSVGITGGVNINGGTSIQ